MTLTVNFNMASGKQITLRLSQEQYETATETFKALGYWVWNEDQTTTVIFLDHVESITTRPT
jgi:hypothetical protein